MNVLVIGGGGREHALCHRLAQSRRLDRLFILPGNGGTAELGTNIPGDPCDLKLALEVARREQIELTIVGPEDPLAAGIVDAFERDGRRIFGPTAAAARLEADKAFAKQLMRQYNVPTGDARIFDDYELARQYIVTRDEGLVVKAAGLARGKGVIVCPDPADALLAAEQMLVHRAFGGAGQRIVVEEKLEGREVSLMVVVSGRTILLLDPAQDYKRLRDGDQGPNTGGMGACCPSDALDPPILAQIESQILVPIVDGLVREQTPYRGVLYAGLMLTPAGPRVLEFNCRLGDPEAQVLLMRLQTDLIDLVEATLDDRLDEVEVRWDARDAVCVIAAAAGYPESSRPGAAIRGLPPPTDDAVIFHSGTARRGDHVVTAGGRVLGATALGATRAAARTRAYELLDRLEFDGMQFRRDIGQ